MTYNFSIFKKIDLFPLPINFNYQSHHQYQTNIGALYSIIIISFSLYILITEGIESIQQNNPTTLTSILANPSPKLSNLTFQANPIAFGLQGFDFHYYQNTSIYTVNFKQCVKQQNSTFQCSDVPLSTCNISDFVGSPWYDYYQNAFQFDQQYCPDSVWWQNNNLQMEGNWDQKDFRYFKINFDICNSSTSKSCGTNEEIKKALDGGVFSLSMFNSMTNLKVKGNPFSQQGMNTFTSVSSDQVNKMILYFRPLEARTDKGFVLQDEVVDKTLQYSYSSVTTSARSTNTFFVISFRYDTTIQINYRKYKKFQEILSYIGGLWGLFVILAQIIIYNYTKFSFYEKIMKNIFTYPDEQGIESNEVNTQKKLINTLNSERNMKQQLKIDSIQENQTQPKDFISKLMLIHHPQNQNKSLKCFSYFKFLCNWKKKENNTNLDIGMKKTKRKFEIINLMNKLQEIDKLKKLFLNSNQLKLFDLILKPHILEEEIDIRLTNPNSQSISKIDNPQQSEVIKQFEKEYGKEIEGLSGYKQIIKQPEMSNIDRKIINMLDNRLRILYQEEIDNELLMNEEILEEHEEIDRHGQIKCMKVRQNLFEFD